MPVIKRLTVKKDRSLVRCYEPYEDGRRLEELIDGDAVPKLIESDSGEAPADEEPVSP